MADYSQITEGVLHHWEHSNDPRLALAAQHIRTLREELHDAKNNKAVVERVALGQLVIIDPVINIAQAIVRDRILGLTKGAFVCLLNKDGTMMTGTAELSYIEQLGLLQASIDEVHRRANS